MGSRDTVAPKTIRIVLKLPDTPFIRSALEELHSNMVDIRLDIPDLEAENPAGSKEWMAAVDDVAAVVESHPVPFLYTRKIDEHLHLMTVERWKEDVRDGMLIDYDGYGYPVKDGKQSERGISPSQVANFPKDATHIAWANR